MTIYLSDHRDLHPATERQVAYVSKLANSSSLTGISWVMKIRDEIARDGGVQINKGRASRYINALKEAQSKAAYDRKMDVPATEAQVNYVRALYEARKNIVHAYVSVATVRLSDGMTKAQASVLIEELKKIKVQKPVIEAEVAQQASIPLGTYTVVLGEDNYITLRVDRASFIKDAEKFMVSYLIGADNETSYAGFAFVDAKGIHVWSKFRNESRIVKAAQVLWAIAQTEAGLGEAHEEFLKNAEAYAIKSGRCARCGKKLTVPTSLHRGLGPDCAAREGL